MIRADRACRRPQPIGAPDARDGRARRRNRAIALALALVGGLAGLRPAAADDLAELLSGFQRTGLSPSEFGVLSSDGSTVAGRYLSWDVFGSVAYVDLHAYVASGGHFVDLGALGGGVYSSAVSGLSADGSVIVETILTWAGNERAVRWSGGIGTDLGTLGGNDAVATGVSADGSVVVGYSSDRRSGDLARLPKTHAFRWSGGVMTDLGSLGAANRATAVSADGAVVIGGISFADGSSDPFRWVGGTMTDLGRLGWARGGASLVSADGSVVVGWLSSQIYPRFVDVPEHAFRWTGGTMTDLGTLGGSISYATGLSHDGSITVGASRLSGDGATHAVRWVGTTIQDLGTLGGLDSRAAAVSADGSVVVGASAVAAAASTTAFRWTQATGMVSIRDLLATAGVNVAGWSLQTADLLSADGRVIVGTGSDPTSSNITWIADCSRSCKVIDAGRFRASIADLGALGTTGNAFLGNRLDAAAGRIRDAADGRGHRTQALTVFAEGAYDSDPATSATLGLTADLPGDLVAGATLGGGRVDTNLAWDGRSHFTTAAGSVFLGYAPTIGPQLSAALIGSHFDGTVRRGYRNGNSGVFSEGDTAGSGFGALARLGWTFDTPWPTTRITPWAALGATRLHTRGWTESGGPFPAVIGGFTSTAPTARLGFDLRRAIPGDGWVTAGLAWGHRLDGGKSASLGASLPGILDVDGPGRSTASDWAELSTGLHLPLAGKVAVDGTIGGLLPRTGVASVQTRLGLSLTF
ncbi:autotransporter domain-containing protein [Siculibacillus lacustris]|uniref:Autotransporter domain-containing protein n=1 Tax=Siculibacillus lacustris TaxID=1549641 RepID=A0A4Q9VDY6_9HYPH|nr:autotransporter domain-containing protein [Siculibacillus lacustris]TBW32916.1 autotransporter domain-containing protein [Siculibacillus lacustris]